MHALLCARRDFPPEIIEEKDNEEHHSDNYYWK